MLPVPHPPTGKLAPWDLPARVSSVTLPLECVVRGVTADATA